MSLIMRILGLVSTTVGLLLGYVIYLFLLNVYILSNWISKVMNAPEAFTIVITIVIITFLLGALILAIIIMLYLIFIGLTFLFDKW